MNKSSNNTFTKLNKSSIPFLIKKVESGEFEIIGEPYIEKVEMFELISADFKKKYNTFKGALQLKII